MFFTGKTVQDLLLIDEFVFRYLHSFHSSLGIQYMTYITEFFDPVHIVMYVIMLVLLLWLHKKDTHLYQFLFSMSAGAVIILLLKYGLKVPRPSHALIPETGYSFASGHAAISAIFFILIAYMYKDHIAHKFLRYLYVFSCVALIFLVSLSRVYLGVHYFTDVLAGVAVGAIISAFSIMYFRQR